MTTQNKNLEFSEKNISLLDEMNNALINVSKIALKLSFAEVNTDGDEILNEIAHIVLSHCNKITEERQIIVDKRKSL